MKYTNLQLLPTVSYITYNHYTFLLSLAVSFVFGPMLLLALTIARALRSTDKVAIP